MLSKGTAKAFNRHEFQYISNHGCLGKLTGFRDAFMPALMKLFPIKPCYNNNEALALENGYDLEFKQLIVMLYGPDRKVNDQFDVMFVPTASLAVSRNLILRQPRSFYVRENSITFVVVVYIPKQYNAHNTFFLIYLINN